MLISRQYSTSLERLGGLVPVVGDQGLPRVRVQNTTVNKRTCRYAWWVSVFAGSWRSEPPADRPPEKNRSDQCLTFNDPLWPMQWELVGVTGNVCVFPRSASSLLLRATNVRMVKDAVLTGISQARFHAWLARDGRWREVGRLQRARERGGGGERDWPCWTETNVGDWRRSEQHTDWCVSRAATRRAHPSLSFLFVQRSFVASNRAAQSYFKDSLSSF